MNSPETLPGDSDHYNLLYRAAQSIKGVSGVTLEIGLRRGGGTETIIRGCLDNGDKRVHMAIDPYGMIPYKAGTDFTYYDYSNDMRREALASIYQWCKERDVTFTYWPMSDTDFFEAFPSGPPFYADVALKVTDFALVHFDGPHGAEEVNTEVRYFAQFAPVGAVWVFDDTNMYDHMGQCDELIRQVGFSLVEITPDNRRMWYRKDRH